MLEKNNHQYEKAILVGLITQNQDEEKILLTLTNQKLLN